MPASSHRGDGRFSKFCRQSWPPTLRAQPGTTYTPAYPRRQSLGRSDTPSKTPVNRWPSSPMSMSSELERGANSSRIEVVEGVRYLTLTVPFNPAPAAGKAHLPNARPPTVEREEKTAGQVYSQRGSPSTLPRRRAHGSAATSVLMPTPAWRPGAS